MSKSVSMLNSRLANEEDSLQKIYRERFEKTLSVLLAHYVLLQSKKSISTVIEQLFEVQINAGKIVDHYFDSENSIDLGGSLAHVFSFIKIDNSRLKTLQSNILLDTKVESCTEFKCTPNFTVGLKCRDPLKMHRNDL